MRVLGYGGFGITYLAQELKTGERVAIKEYFPTDLAVRLEDGTVASKTDDDQDIFDWGLDRFVNEARTLARFSHPNIVGVQRFLQLNHTAYMVMDYQQGVPFGQILDEHGDLDESEILEILPPLLEGLAAVHEAGVLHRDIKPDNIFIRNDGSPVLLDFGAARIEMGKQSRSLHRVFTPGYAAPEQYESGDSQGPWTDVYGMAAVLYSAISGRAPLEAPARTGALVRSQIDSLEPARQVGHGRFQPHFLAAIDWGLQIDPERRPQDVSTWRDALLKPPAAQPAGAEMTIQQQAKPEPVEETSTLVAGQPTDRAPAKRKSGKWLGLAAAVLALVTVGSVIGWQVFKKEEQRKASTVQPDKRQPAVTGRKSETPKAKRRSETDDLKKADRDDRKPADKARRKTWQVGPLPTHDSPSLAHALKNAPDKARIILNLKTIRGGISVKRGLLLIGTGEGASRTSFICFDEPCLTFNGKGSVSNIRVLRYRRGHGFDGPAIRVNEGIVTIVGTQISSQGDVGIDVAGGSLRLFQSQIFNNGSHGIIIRPSARDVLIIGSRIFDNRHTGIVINARTSTKLQRNTVYKNLRHGVMILGRSEAVLEGNLVRKNGAFGIHLAHRARMVSRDNSVRGNVRGSIIRRPPPRIPARRR